MPLIKVQTSVAGPDQDTVTTLLKTLSASLAQQLGKSESYVMTAFEGDVPMTMAGSTEPSCYIEIKSVGTMGADKTKAMSRAFCQQVETSLGIAGDRIYLFFSDVPGSMWGWNGRTFG
ncbi:MAG: phenylpyruvate tautomerase MIF-related protein [Cyanobacteria bacterium P01_H01_bin.119]